MLTEDGVADLVPAELIELACAIGLLVSNGSAFELNGGWFEQPLERLRGVLTRKAQQEALVRLAGRLAKPVAGKAGWHPLFQDDVGTLALTMERTDGPSETKIKPSLLTIGLAGSVSLGATQLEVALPLVRGTDPAPPIGSKSVALIAGTADGALRLRLRVPLTLPTNAAIGLTAFAVELTHPFIAQDPSPGVSVVLEGLRVGSAAAVDRSFALGSADITQELPALAEILLGLLAAGDAGEASTVPDLLALIGWHGTSLPPLPVAALAGGPDALAAWLSAAVDKGKSELLTLGAKLLGATDVQPGQITGAGTAASPLEVPVPADSLGVSVALWVEEAPTRRLHIGLVLRSKPASTLAFEARLDLVALPMGSGASFELLPWMSCGLSSAGPLGSKAGPVQFDKLRAGLDGKPGAFQPFLSLSNVELNGTKIGDLDLANPGALATGGVVQALREALGLTSADDALSALARLAGLHGSQSLDPTKLLPNPLVAIASLHRDLLTGATPGWGEMLAAIGKLLGLSASVQASGGVWTLELGRQGLLSLYLVATRLGTEQSPDGVELGLRLSMADQGGLDLHLDLAPLSLLTPQSSPLDIGTTPRVALELGYALDLPDYVPEGPLSAQGAKVVLKAAWNQGLVVSGTVTGLKRLTATGAVALQPIELRSDGGGLAGTYPALREIAAWAATRWGGEAGQVLAGILGLHADLPGLGKLTLQDGAAWVSDPWSALLGQVRGAAAAGTIPALLAGTGRLFGGRVGSDISRVPQPGVGGGGLREEPWSVALDGYDLLAWLEPEGPKPPATALADEDGIFEIAARVAALAPHVPALAGTPPELYAPCLGDLVQAFEGTKAPSAEDWFYLAEALRRLEPLWSRLSDPKVTSDLKGILQALDGLSADGQPLPFDVLSPPAAPKIEEFPKLLKGALVVLAQSLPRTAPTAIGLGVRIRPARPGEGSLRVQSSLRLDLGSLSLSSTPLWTPGSRISARVEVERPGGWLVGERWSSRESGRVRVRRAELGVDVVGGAGGSSWKPVARFLDAAWNGPTIAVVDLVSHPSMVLSLIDEVVGALSAATRVTPEDAANEIPEIPADGTARALLEDLSALGVLKQDGRGSTATWAVDRQGWQAFTTDPSALLHPRLAVGALGSTLAAREGTLDWAAEGLSLVPTLEAGGIRLRSRAPREELAGPRLELDLGWSLQAGTGLNAAKMMVGGFLLSIGNGAVSVGLRPWLDEIELYPVQSSDLEARLRRLASRLLFSAGASAVLGPLLPERIALGPLALLIEEPWRLAAPGALGRENGGLDPALVARLLRVLAQLGVAPATASGVVLLGSAEAPRLVLEAVDQGSGPACAIRVRSLEAIGLVSSLELGLALGKDLRPMPMFAVTAAPTAGVALRLGLAASGPTLALTLPIGGDPKTIELLPRVQGLDQVLAGLAAATLIEVLNGLAGLVPSDPPSVGSKVLAVADALGLREGTPKKFVSLDKIRSSLDSLDKASAALQDLAKEIMAPVTLTVGAKAGTPTVLVKLPGLALGPLTVQLDDLGFDGSSVAGNATIELTNVIPGLKPALKLGFDGTSAYLGLHPSAKATGHVQLLPSFDVKLSADDLRDPLLDIARYALVLLGIQHRSKTVCAALTLGSLLEKTGFVKNNGGILSPVASPPALTTALLNTLQALSTSIDLSDKLTLTLGKLDKGSGLGLRGRVEVDLGGPVIRLLIGEGTTGGLDLVLIQDNAFKPALIATDVGLQLLGRDDGPLVSTDIVRIGGILGTLSFDVSENPELTGVSAKITGLAIPLGGLGPDNAKGDPVAGGMLGGDDGPRPQPTFGLGLVWDGKDAKLTFDGQAGRAWIGVHAHSGPLYVEQIGVGLREKAGKLQGRVLLDASVEMGGLHAGLDDLALVVPLASLDRPSEWSVELGGLAIGYSGPGVVIAGGLRKMEDPVTHDVQYAGMLQVKIGAVGLVAVGGWGQVSDGEGDYSTFFVFAGLFVVIGLPPILEIRGIGLGVGYNRTLLLPSKPQDVPKFTLVRALDDAGSFTDDPMGALEAMQKQIPPQRGALWIAVGLNAVACSLVPLTAVVYARVGGGIEVGLLGVARVLLPSEDLALANVELAVLARYSTTEQLMSAQAQLTDNSWLISRDCRLTGGFAFFVWLGTGDFVLSMGGYHPAFQVPQGWPAVPRLGFVWSLWGGALMVSGETYFALTNTAIMFGGRLEARLGPDSFHVTFVAWADVLISWDPLHVVAEIGITVGLRLHLTIELLFGKVDLDLSLSIGASLHLEGPPMGGWVTVDYGIGSLTVDFGGGTKAPEYIHWSAFKAKYLDDRGGAEPVARAHVAQGLLPPEPPGGEPSPGTEASPWQLGCEFEIQTESRLPASFWSAPTELGDSRSPVDLAPLGRHGVATPTRHLARLSCWTRGQWQRMSNVGFDLEASKLHDPAQTAGGVPVALRLHHEVLLAEGLKGQFPEGLWRYFDGGPPAEAKTIVAFSGMRIRFRASPVGQGRLVAVDELVDDKGARHLPFAEHAGPGKGLVLHLALGLVPWKAALATRSALDAVRVLASPTHADLRRALGLPANAMSALSLAQVLRGPALPRASTLWRGLGFDPGVLARAPRLRKPERIHRQPLRAPRLQAWMALPTSPSTTAPFVPHTTVVRDLQGERRAPPALPAVLGARLVRVPAPGAPAATAMAGQERALSSRLDRGRRREGMEAGHRLLDEGIILGAGQVQVWELAWDRGSLELKGAATQVVFLDRASRALESRELAPEKRERVRIPRGSTRVVLSCLGRVPPELAEVVTRMGIGLLLSAPGGLPAIGWEHDTPLVRLSRDAWLARSAVVHLDRPGAGSDPVVRAAGEALRGCDILSTAMSGRAETLLVAWERPQLDQVEPIVAVSGIDVGDPLPVELGRRLVLAYPLRALSEDPAWQVSIGSPPGWTPLAVLGLPGAASEHATSLERSGWRRHLTPSLPSSQGAVRLCLLEAP